MRKFIYGNITGITALALLFCALHKPTVITTQDKIDALALVLDGGAIINPHKKVASVPIPKRKPEQGYTLAFREDMNDFIKGFVE